MAGMKKNVNVQRAKKALRKKTEASKFKGNSVNEIKNALYNEWKRKQGAKKKATKTAR